MKYKLTALLLVVGVLLGALVWTNREQKTKPKVFTTQQECEANSSASCKFTTCDYKCDPPYKGWVAKDYESYPKPTREQLETVRQIPREKCSCWDGQRNECLPTSECE